jgi:hypothetical protein
MLLKLKETTASCSHFCAPAVLVRVPARYRAEWIATYGVGYVIVVEGRSIVVPISSFVAEYNRYPGMISEGGTSPSVAEIL